MYVAGVRASALGGNMGELVVAHSPNGGVTWDAPEIITENVGGQDPPILSVNGGEVYIVYGQGLDSREFRVLFRRLGAL